MFFVEEKVAVLLFYLLKSNSVLAAELIHLVSTAEKVCKGLERWPHGKGTLAEDLCSVLHLKWNSLGGANINSSLQWVKEFGFLM